MKKKSRRNGMLLLLAAILVCWLVRVIQVNRTYPEAETKRYSFGETLEQDGLAIRVLESRWAEEEEVAASMASDGDEMAKFGERKQLLVTVQLKNTGSESKRVEVYQYMIELPCYSNGIIMEAFIYYNPEKSLNPTLEAGEELELTLPFTIYETTCRKEYWETIEEKDAWLDISLYPVKRQLDAKAQREEQDGRGKVE